MVFWAARGTLPAFFLDETLGFTVSTSGGHKSDLSLALHADPNNLANPQVNGPQENYLID